MNLLRSHDPTRFRIRLFIIFRLPSPNRSELPLKEMENLIILRFDLKPNSLVIRRPRLNISHNNLNLIRISELTQRFLLASKRLLLSSVEVRRVDHHDLIAQVRLVYFSFFVDMRSFVMLFNQLTRVERKVNLERFRNFCLMLQILHFACLEPVVVEEPMGHKSEYDD